MGSLAREPSQAAGQRCRTHGASTAGAAGPQACLSPAALGSQALNCTLPAQPASGDTRQRPKLQPSHGKTTRRRRRSVCRHRGRAEPRRHRSGAVLGGGLPEQALPLSCTPSHSIRRSVARRTDKHVLKGFKPLSWGLEEKTRQPRFLLLKPPRRPHVPWPDWTPRTPLASSVSSLQRAPSDLTTCLPGLGAARLRPVTC